MMTIDEFLEGVKPESKESKLAEAYKHALADFESEQSRLLKCLRVEKTSKGIIPVFSSEAESLALSLKEAESRVTLVRSDIEAFLQVTGSEPSLLGLADKLARSRRTLSNVTLEASNVRAHAIRQNPKMSALEVESLEPVQAALDKKDRAQAELEPLITDLETRLSKARAILEKYD